MSAPPDTPYHPVGTGDGHQDDPPIDLPGVYRDNPSPTAPSMDPPLDPPFNPGDLARDSLVEDGMVRPRFLGHAAEGTGPRGSLASSFVIPPSNDNSSSIYALNPLGHGRDSTTGYSTVPYQDDPHDSDFVPGTVSPGRRGAYLEEKRDAYAPPSKSKRKIIIGAIAIGVILVAIAIVVALYFTVIKKNGKTSSDLGGSDGGNNNNNNNNNGNNTTPSSNLVKSGGDGSTITLDDGTQMTYSNKFGGTWYWDPNDPFNNNAQAQSWTPPLNQSFNWGTDRIYGSVSRSSCPVPLFIISFHQRQPRWLACPGTCKFPNLLLCSPNLR